MFPRTSFVHRFTIFEQFFVSDVEDDNEVTLFVELEFFDWEFVEERSEILITVVMIEEIVFFSRILFRIVQTGKWETVVVM